MLDKILCAILGAAVVLLYRMAWRAFRYYPSDKPYWPSAFFWFGMIIHTFTTATLVWALKAWTGKEVVGRIGHTDGFIEAVTSIWMFPGQYVPSNFPVLLQNLGLVSAGVIVGTIAALWAAIVNRSRA